MRLNYSPSVNQCTFCRWGKNPLESDAVKSVAAEVEKRLEGKGRILLRKSGTEPLIRVMVECQDAELAQQCAEEIAEAVKKIN